MEANSKATRMTKPLPHKIHLEKGKKGSKLGFFILTLIVLGIIGIIIFGVTFIYPRILPQSNLAEHLPAAETVGYIEMDGLNLPTKLMADGGQEKFIGFLSQLVEFEFQPAVKAFGTGKVAYVLLDVEGEVDKPVLLIQAKSKGTAMSYFKTLLLDSESVTESEDENAIYSFEQGQPYSFKFLDRYVAISNDENLLEQLKKNPEKSLSADPDYQKSINNLPRNKWLSGYLNVKKISLAKNEGTRNLLEPLKATLHNFAFTVRQDEKGFQLNTFLNLDKTLLSLSAKNPEEKFSHQLTDYLPSENLALYVGGQNFAEEWLNTLETLSNFNPSYGLILEGLVRGQTDKIFGTEVNLRNDLYPLFEGEYALALGKTEQSNEIELVLAHQDKAFVEKKMRKMAQGFESIAASFAPKISVVTLPDGSESRELVPDDTTLNKVTDKVGDNEVNCTEVGSKTAFCYSVTDEVVVMANSKELLEKSLKAKGTSSLSEGSAFKETTGNLSQISDEITFMNLERLNSLLAAYPYVQLLEPLTTQLDSASWVKQYFDDGVSTEGYVLLK